MQAKGFSQADYLKRIGFAEPVSASIESVAAVMRQQLRSLAFENIDVQHGKVVSMATDDIIRKIIGGQRGGYCYELNGLFAMFLESLGISYQFVACRPLFYPERRPRTHMAIVATIAGETYLCDLGFGAYGIREPIKLTELDTEIKQACDYFLLSLASDGFYTLSARVEGEWQKQYAFDLSLQEWVDFAPANYMNSTHPDTLFVQKLIALIHTDKGRTILLDNRLKLVESGQVKIIDLAEADRESTLREHFFIEV